MFDVPAEGGVEVSAAENEHGVEALWVDGSGRGGELAPGEPSGNVRDSRPIDDVTAELVLLLTTRGRRRR
ncbi:MAG: hypothetical protein ACYDHU_04960 [Acidimicrobiales bacterium]